MNLYIVNQLQALSLLWYYSTINVYITKYQSLLLSVCFHNSLIDGIRSGWEPHNILVYLHECINHACTFKKFSSFYVRGHNSKRKRITQPNQHGWSEVSHGCHVTSIFTKLTFTLFLLCWRIAIWSIELEGQWPFGHMFFCL